MSLISENIRHLRKGKGWTQGEFAEQIGIKRALVGAYEEARANPRIEYLRIMAELFDITLDTLINEDVTVPIEMRRKKQKTTRGGEILAITVDKEDKENIELVPQKASAGYLNGYADPEYIRELPRFQLPMLPSNATYRAFEITGDSMLPVIPGTIVVGEYIDNLLNIKSGHTYVVVTEKEGVVYKRVFNHFNENEKFMLVSDNKNYEPYLVDASEIVEAWMCKAFISAEFPDVGNAAVEGSFEQITSMLTDLKNEVVKLREE